MEEQLELSLEEVVNHTPSQELLVDVSRDTIQKDITAYEAAVLSLEMAMMVSGKRYFQEDQIPEPIRRHVEVKDPREMAGE